MVGVWCFNPSPWAVILLNSLIQNTICNCEDWVPSINRFSGWHLPWMVWVHLPFVSELHWKRSNVNKPAPCPCHPDKWHHTKRPSLCPGLPGWRTASYLSWLPRRFISWLPPNSPALLSAMIGLLIYHFFYFLCLSAIQNNLPFFQFAGLLVPALSSKLTSHTELFPPDSIWLSLIHPATFSP